MSRKDQEFMNKIFRFFKDVSKSLPPLSKDGKSAKPFDIVQGVEEFINKRIDGVTIGVKNLPPYMSKVLEINRDAQRLLIIAVIVITLCSDIRGQKFFISHFIKNSSIRK